MTRVRQEPEDTGRSEADAYRHPDPIADAALTWFVTLQDAAADAETLAAYQAWRRSDPRHAAAFDRLASISRMPELTAATLASHGHSPLQDDAFPALPRDAVARMPARRRRPARAWVRLGSLAAAVLLAVFALSLVPALTVDWRADFATAAGDRLEIGLPDGSRLLLNTASAVALDFGQGRRHVRLLRGEAFFDVVPDPSRPFHVLAGFSTVEVTGTAFSVRTDGDADSVFLERGRVTVRDDEQPDRTQPLAPGEQVIASALGLSPVARVRPELALAWREGRYVFHEQPMSAVVDNLRRYHAAPILVLDGRVNQQRVSGNYRLEDPVGALRSLAAITGIRMTVLPGGLIVLG